jgi:hypothetical protein
MLVAGGGTALQGEAAPSTTVEFQTTIFAKAINMRFCAVALALAGALLVTSAAQAVPIIYDTLFDGVTESDVNTQPAGVPSEPDGAYYYSFAATAGSLIELEIDRESGHYDASAWVLFGTFGDTDDFGAAFDAGDSSFVIFTDDEDPPALPGPFGDPHVIFLAPSTGLYTVAVTNFLSSAGPPNPFNITVTGIVDPSAVPEPASMAIWGLLTVGLVGVRKYRRRKAS